MYDPFELFQFEDRVGERAHEIFLAHRNALQQRRRRTASLVLAQYFSSPWSRLRGLVLDEDYVSINDALEAGFGRIRLTHGLTKELQDIEQVVANLYLETQDVAPFVRLQWVELLSSPGFGPFSRDLARFPGWASVELHQRHRLQALVDWIFGRFDLRIAWAKRFCEDLVQMVFMLSSHPALRRAFEAETVELQPARAESLVSIRVDRDFVRLGQHALLFDQANTKMPVARGIITDLSQGLATVQVISTRGGSAVLPRRVQLVDPTQGPAVPLAGQPSRFVGPGTRFR